MYIRYVNLASTPGGNGTTNATTGANRAYASSAEAEAAEQTTLTDDIVVYCCGGFDTSQLVIDGWTVGAYFIAWSGNPGESNGAHAGVYSTGKYGIQINNGTSGAIQIVEEKAVVTRLIAENLNSGGIGIGQFATLGDAVKIRSNVIKGASAAGSGIGVGAQDVSNTNVLIADNVVYGWGTGIYARSASSGAVVNNTSAKNGTGIRGRSGGVRAINNLAFGNTTNWVNEWDAANSLDNAFGTAGDDPPGSPDIDLSSYAGSDIFIDYTNNDFHLNSSGSAYSLLDNDGVGPASNSYVQTIDIDGDARSGTTTSVGADMVASGGDTKSVSDSGTGVDAIAIGVTLSISDIGVGTDQGPAPAVGLSISDSATGADALVLGINLSISDSGAGADDVLAGILAAVSDAATGADAVASVSSAFTVADTASGNDAIGLDVQITLADTASGADAINIITETLIAVADAGSGVDSISIAVSIPVADAGTGTDQLTIAALLAVADAAGGADVVVRFDAGTRIATISFTLARRAIAFAIAQRAVAFGLASRTMTFTLN